MSENLLMEIITEGLITAVKIAAPILITVMVVGIIISIIQATTQIQEQTLTFVPKLIAGALVGVICGSWMLHTLVTFTERIFELIIKVST